MSDKTKKRLYFSDKPIDLSKIETITDESWETSIDWEEATKPHTISFDCKATKETAEFFKRQMEELEAEEKKILDKYRDIAKYNAEYYAPILNKLASEESQKELLEYIIRFALCKGWNDCFDINVKHEKKNI